MRRFKNILFVASDNGWEEIALKRAVTIAKDNKAKFRIAHEEVDKTLGKQKTSNKIEK